jgi:hypothetical protein
MKADKNCIMLKVMCLDPIAYALECPKGTGRKSASVILQKIVDDINSEREEDIFEQKDS